MIKSEEGKTVLTGEEPEILADMTCIIREFIQTSKLPEPVRFAAVLKAVTIAIELL